jgi:S-adenosylmethionine:tRNA ribosyltransferase-isomerase
MESINLNDFDYELPDERIAKQPNQNRDQSKLLVFKDGQIIASQFTKIVDFLPQNSHLVFNNTKVIPARFYFNNSNEALIEILLLQPILSNYQESFSETSSTEWSCIIGNKKKWKSNEILSKTLVIGSTQVLINATYKDYDQNIILFTWDTPKFTFSEIINSLGEIPLPPYLNRKANSNDAESYQTVYSTHKGAIAAPTAGLHFTEKVFENLLQHNFTTQFITLHVGAGTFMPVKVANVVEHKMHKEQIIFQLTDITQLIANSDKTIAVGTTSMRALESLYWFGVKLKLFDLDIISNNSFFIEKLMPYQSYPEFTINDSLSRILIYMTQNNLETITGETEILIMPSYKFQICKGIITNFHQPKSTLLLLISALIGTKWKQLYDYALKNDFQFLSYGDSSLILP